MNTYKYAAVLIFLLGFVSKAAYADKRKVQVQWADAGTKIQGLTWAAEEVNPSVSNQAGEPKFTVPLEGTFDHAGFSLLASSKPVVVKDGHFRIVVPLQGPEAIVSLRAISPRGEIEPARVRLSLLGYAELKAEALAAQSRHVTFSPSLGLSFITVQQTGVTNFAETAITAKLGGSYPLGASAWDIGLSGFLTVLPLSSNQTGVSARFFGLNGRVGYRFTNPSSVWQFNVLGGLYFTTMSVTHEAFGFSNELGPQIFPVLKRVFSQGNIGSAYLKFSPITDGFKLLQLSSREIAGGLAWIHPLGKEGTSVSVALDLSNLKLTYASGTLNTSSTSVSVGYSF